MEAQQGQWGGQDKQCWGRWQVSEAQTAGLPVVVLRVMA